MAKYVYGIKSVKFGTPTGLATMPGTLTAWAQTVEGTFTLAESEDTLKSFKVEETATPVLTIVSEAGEMTLTWSAYDLSPAIIAIVKGGTATGSTKWAAPATKPTISLAIEVETTDGAKFNIYKTSIFSTFDGAVTRGDLLQMKTKAVVQDPGSGVSPFDITFPA